MAGWQYDGLKIILALVLVGLNGFFVAAEFALVKVRRSRLGAMVQAKRPMAVTAVWLADRLDASLSACQLGITMASLGLGWMGEPAVAHLLRPLLYALGIDAETWVHGLAFLMAFAAITAVHLVLGEQAPKIAALRNPEALLLFCAAPLKGFYYLLYPFLVLLSGLTDLLLRVTGVSGAGALEVPHSEEEIRTLIRQAHAHGELSRSEQRLINAVFEFDEMVCRQVMVPRIDVVFLEFSLSPAEIFDRIRYTRHSRYPVCEGSMDHVRGVLHVKDLIGLPPDAAISLPKLMRTAHFVPETMPVRRLLRHFQATHHHMAFPVDEHGTVTGMVTLENVLEPLVGSVEDEFDDELPDIVPAGSGQFLVSGGTPVQVIRRRFGLALEEEAADTLSGLLVSQTGRLPSVGDRIELPGATAEVVEVRGRRAAIIRLTLTQPLAYTE